MGYVRGAEFLPRMQAQTRALRTLTPLSYRRFAGAIADVWSVRGEAGGGGFYIAPDPRIVIFLDDQAPAMRLRTDQTGHDTAGVQGFYIPAGVPLWSSLTHAQDLNHIDFHLDGDALSGRLRAAGVRTDLAQPRMIMDSPSLLALGRLAADEVRNPRRAEMVLDGLLSATLGEIFTDAPDAMVQTSGGLTPRQFAAVERHMRANLSRHVPVAELAEVAGLSESWFAHCFKQHCDDTPLRWQSRMRLEAAKAMMADATLSLAEIAHATGFSDQAHLSRLFRAAFGLPPSVWRREHLPRF